MIEFGTAVLTYNQWTNYQNPGIRQFFRQATDDDIRNLQPGDTIWIDTDPIHPNGKVDGFVKRKMDHVEGKKVYFDGGMTTLRHTIFFVDDESVLAALINADPRMTDIIGDSGRAASQLVHEMGPAGAIAYAQCVKLLSLKAQD